MPPNNLPVHMEYVLFKSVDPKVLWVVSAEAMGTGGWKIILSPPIPCLNWGGGDRWCHHLSCRSPTCFRFWHLYSTKETYLAMSVGLKALNL
ncbi:hypothetical protein TNCV_4596141 [Trichonephila clavipes]|uniref:Uncharacterized protein n=1 Tax=Trichonephila clavipes TaxID=2585209 RepID=A0A8X6WGU6_TRICX|nr:hypothetical protein TNCV_4596141 [Trichonephila clavipes]